MKTRLLTIVVAAALATGVLLVSDVRPTSAQVGTFPTAGPFPLPVPIPASAVNGAGVATVPLTMPVGTGGAVSTLGGTLFTSTTAASTTDLLEDTLLSYTLPANTLAVNGRGVRITAWGTFAANANSKTTRLYFGSTVVVANAASTSGVAWRVVGYVLRAGATTQVAYGDGVIGAYVADAATASSPTETLSGTVLIKVTGQGPTTIGDITQTGLLVEAI